MKKPSLDQRSLITARVATVLTDTRKSLHLSSVTVWARVTTSARHAAISKIFALKLTKDDKTGDSSVFENRQVMPQYSRAPNQNCDLSQERLR